MRAQWMRFGAGEMLAARLNARMPAFGQPADSPLGAAVADQYRHRHSKDSFAFAM